MHETNQGDDMTDTWANLVDALENFDPNDAQSIRALADAVEAARC
jgi:hypothetical protein